ncbi:uncharacterized protein TNCV_2671221 [Trichonephila clavipes]|nr:uncharacterized protein TNCV_2671221 [Trichonephila clavipes]
MDPTPDAWFDMVINPFIHNFPMLKVHTPNTSVHIWTTRADYERVWCPKRFSTVAYLEMKRTSENRSCVALDNTTSDEDPSNNADNKVLDDMSPNNADNEVLDGMSPNNADNVTSNNIEVDTLHASDSMDYSSSDGVLETSTNIQASLDGLHGTSDDMQSSSDDMQSSSDDMASDDMQSSSDDMASDSLPGTSDDMASDTMGPQMIWGRSKMKQICIKENLSGLGETCKHPQGLGWCPQFASTWLKRSLFG